MTLGDYISTEWGPWSEANHRDHARTQRRLVRVFESLLETDLDAITHRAVERIRTDRRRTGTSAATINRDTAVLKAALTKALEWDLISLHPLAKLRNMKEQTAPHGVYLEEWEMAAIMREAIDQGPTNATAAMAGLALQTGMRHGEVCKIVWSNVRLADGPQVTIPATISKSGKTRHVPLTPLAVSILKTRRATATGNGLVFERNGEQLPPNRPAFRAFLKAAGITRRFRFHDLRHAFASRLIMAGGSIFGVKNLLGHASVQTTENFYAHLAPSWERDLVGLLTSTAEYGE